MMKFSVGLMVVMSSASAQNQDLGPALEVARSLDAFNGLDNSLTLRDLLKGGNRRLKDEKKEKSDKEGALLAEEEEKKAKSEKEKSDKEGALLTVEKEKKAKSDKEKSEKEAKLAGDELFDEGELTGKSQKSCKSSQEECP